MGARVLKELTLRDGHPFLYQRHIFEGGAGALPVANHAMVRLPTGGRISYSPKRWAETPTAPLEADPQRGVDPAYPARSTDLTSFPRADGGTVDLTAYPIDRRPRGFRDAGGSAPAPRSAGRRSCGPAKATSLILKNPRVCRSPCCGIRTAGATTRLERRHPTCSASRTAALVALRARRARSPTMRWPTGIPTSLPLDPPAAPIVRHVIGAVPTPGGLAAVADRPDSGDYMIVTDAAGAEPCACRSTPGFFGGHLNVATVSARDHIVKRFGDSPSLDEPVARRSPTANSWCCWGHRAAARPRPCG